MKTVPNAPELYARRRGVNKTRQYLIDQLASLDHGQTMTLDELTEASHLARSTLHEHIKQIAEYGIAHNTSGPGEVGRYKLTDLGRSRYVTPEADDPEQDAGEPSVAEDEEDEQPNITPPRLWHAASQPPAPPGCLNPWTGTTLREGALDFMRCQSRGIGA